MFDAPLYCDSVRLFKNVTPGSAFEVDAINRTVHPEAIAAKPVTPALSHKKVTTAPMPDGPCSLLNDICLQAFRPLSPELHAESVAGTELALFWLQF